MLNESFHYLIKKINPIRYCNIQNQSSEMSQKGVDKMQMRWYEHNVNRFVTYYFLFIMDLY